MNIMDDFKQQAIKRIKKLKYENKKLKQQNDELTKQKSIIESALNISKSETAKVVAEFRHYKKIIAAQKRKIVDEGLVETDEEMEMPLFGKVEKINITGERIKPKQ